MKFSTEYMNILTALGFLREAFDHAKLREPCSILRGAFGEDRYCDSMPDRDHKTLLVSEGGPGDEIRFATMYKELRERIDDLAITADPRLLSILQRSFPYIKFIPVRRHRPGLLSEMPPEGIYRTRNLLKHQYMGLILDNVAFEYGMACDRVGYVMNVRSDLRPRLESFPDHGPILLIDRKNRRKWRRRLDRKVKDRRAVGLSWRSLLINSSRNRHYSKIEDWAALFRRRDIAVVNLQPGTTDEERGALKLCGLDMIEFDDLDLTNDIENVGGLMLNLDMVIAPCTAVMEFAGALGVPTIFFSRSAQNDWRIRSDGSDIWHGSVAIRTADMSVDFSDCADSIVRGLF